MASRTDNSGTKFSDLVERWRPLVEKYFPPELVDKALYVISYESGGNPKAAGDGGAARGLFQIQDSRNFSSRPNADYLDDPENNIKYAAQSLGAASGKWTDWGEGSSYNGQAFGALGNHPYPGGSGGASSGGMINPNVQLDTSQIDDQRGRTRKLPALRAPGGSRFVGDTPDTTTTSSGLSGIFRNALGNAALAGNVIQTGFNNRKTLSGRIKAYEATGDFNADAAGYFNATQKAYEALHKYQASSKDDLVIDEKSGVVLKIVGNDINGKPIQVVDTVGTKFLQDAMNNSDALDRLYAGKKAGIFNAGQDAATAYLTSEKDKATEATRKYEDFNKRITDLVALDNLPISRAASLASTLNSINATNSKRTSRYESMANYKPAPVTDMSPFSQAIKETIPEKAPSPYNINPGAFNTYKTNSVGGNPAAATNGAAPGGVPARPPDQVLEDYGIVPPSGQMPGTAQTAPGTVKTLPWGPDSDPRDRYLGRNSW